MAEHKESQETMVIIVGAGPSGLATAAYLTHLSVPYIIFERDECYASLWKKYAYDRVHLHLVKQFCQLPLMTIPKNYSTYLSKKEFTDYLNDYVLHFKIKPKCLNSVESATYNDVSGKWSVRARNLEEGSDHEYRSRFLIVATGENCDAFVPKVEGLEGFVGELIHSTEYKNGEKFRGKNVLVVGSGNSGMEISLDLVNYGARTSVVVRSPIHILSRTMMLSGLILMQFLRLTWVDSLLCLMSKAVFGVLKKYGIGKPKEGPLTTKVKYGKDPVIDMGSFEKIKSGEVQVLPGMISIRGNTVAFENGRQYSFDAIVFATGFKRPTKEWLKGDDYLLNDDGVPKPDFPNHWKGKNGLYCAGLGRRGLFGAAMDAQKIAHHIKAELI